MERCDEDMGMECEVNEEMRGRNGDGMVDWEHV